MSIKVCSGSSKGSWHQQFKQYLFNLMDSLNNTIIFGTILKDANIKIGTLMNQVNVN